jgi:hypothetical protein
MPEPVSWKACSDVYRVGREPHGGDLGAGNERDGSRAASMGLAQARIPDEVLVVLRREDREAWDVVRGADSALPVRGVEVHRPGHTLPYSRLEGSAGRYVAFLDADVIPEPMWLAGLADLLGSRVGCAGGRVVGDDVSRRVHRDARAVLVGQADPEHRGSGVGAVHLLA